MTQQKLPIVPDARARMLAYADLVVRDSRDGG